MEEMYKLHVKIFRWNKDKGSDIRRLSASIICVTLTIETFRRRSEMIAQPKCFSRPKKVCMHVVQILTQHTPDFRTRIILLHAKAG